MADGVTIVGTYVPRPCGIATFTRDLGQALDAVWPGRVSVLALDRHAATDPLAYPPEVIGRIGPDALDGQRLRTMLDLAGTAVLSVQHEFGIFGGQDGVRVLDLVEAARQPVITTLHTVPVEPTASQAAILGRLVDASARTVVMSRRGAQLLVRRYGADPARTAVIPHGVPDLPFVSTDVAKAQLGLGQDQVILSFGLIGPSKGLERAIQALARALPDIPRARLVIAGATHPEVAATTGEAYRESLVRLARRLGVEDRVTFIDRYLSAAELARWLLAADVFVTLYGDLGQVTSGTLAYAVASGRAVVSTPYEHARELLDEGRGVLVPVDDEAAAAAAFVRLLDDDAARLGMRRRAWCHGRQMVWPAVAAAYVGLLQEVLDVPSGAASC